MLQLFIKPFLFVHQWNEKSFRLSFFMFHFVVEIKGGQPTVQKERELRPLPLMGMIFRFYALEISSIIKHIMRSTTSCSLAFLSLTLWTVGY